MSDFEEMFVAAILDERRLAITAGSEQGVEPGDIFALLSATAEKVIHPKTHKVIGYFNLEKVRVRAQSVQQQMTICITFSSESMPVSVTEFLAAPPPRLAVPPSIPFRVGDDYVQVGDRVVRV
jgi:hypothetical protein